MSETIITISHRDWSNNWRISLNLKELLFPDPWRDPETNKLIKEYPLTKIRKIFTLIRRYGDPETIATVDDFIRSNQIRRSKKYLEIWEAIK